MEDDVLSRRGSALVDINVVINISELRNVQ